MLRMLTFIALLTLSACAAPERPVADSSVIPPFPPPAVNLGHPLATPVLPQLQCLQKTGLIHSPLCPGAGSWELANSVTEAEPK